jgi:hypothetical protein
MTKNVNLKTALTEPETDPFRKAFFNSFAYQIRCRLY